MIKKRFLSILVLLCLTVSGAWAQSNLVAVPNPSSIYEPTQIENGGFETQPKMAGGYGAYRIPNGTNQGWNTTDIGDQCFEWLADLSWHTPGLSPIGTYCAEMNADNSATLYQDLYTNGGDVIRWSLGHAARTENAEDEQDMRVEVGAPLYNGDNIVYPTGVNNNINTNINPDTKATYHSNGIDNPTEHNYGFNGQNLENLKVKKSAAKQWYFASGVYVVPDFQPVTRFAFVSENAESPGSGNLLDEITFSTLIGDLSATYGDNNSVVIKGYWGETDTSKKLIIDINGTPNEVDMTSVSGQNFVITMTEACYDNKPSDITIYHQDYVSAARTISVGYPISASVADVEVDYDGNAHTISPAVTVPESGYTLKYGTLYGGISLDELTYTTIGTYPIYYSISAPGYTTYKGKATLRIKSLTGTVSFTVNDTALGSIGVLSAVYSEDLETLDDGTFALPDGWTNDATYPWVVANHTLKSGNYHQGKTNSTIQATYNFTTPGKISFSYRLNSEAYSDIGYFSIDNVQKLKLLNGSNKGTFTANVDAGTHTFKWWYSKDKSGDWDEDAFFIDNIVIYEHRTDITDTTCVNGDKIDLLAIPKEGSYFVRWDDDSTDKNRAVTIDQDMTITAYFNAYPHVTVNSNDPSKGTATINKTAGVMEAGDGTFYVVPGSEVTFTATPNTGESFYVWLDEDYKTLSTESTFNMTINEDKTLTAYFDPVCGDGLTWGLNAGVLTISYDGVGTGVMDDFDNSENPAPWFSSIESITSVIIPDGVTRIGNYAFRGCTALTSIEIPGSVTSIGEGAFYECSGLETVTINAESLESYGTNAFQGTAEGLKIYVPARSVATYKAAWAAYEDKIAAIPYTVTLKEGTEDADNWTITPPEAKTTGVAEGTEVTATYSGTKLVKSVKAVKAVKKPTSLTITDGNEFSTSLDIAGCTTWDEVIAKNSDKIKKDNEGYILDSTGQYGLLKGKNTSVKADDLFDPNATDYKWAESN